MELKSLYNVCLDFVAKNLDMLESLCGFPDTIGKEIFEYAAFHNYFTDQGKRCNALKIFSDAYRDCGFLDSLCLSGQHLFLNDVIDGAESLWLFHGVKHLDLMDCGLGDKHEILPHLGMIHSLQTLSLAKNSLSEDGVRRLTARARMFKENSSQIEHLDLSDNPSMSMKCLDLLHCFKALAIVKITKRNKASSISHSSCSKKWSVSCCDCHKARFNISTQGWATCVIERWKEEYRDKGSKFLHHKQCGKGEEHREISGIVQDVKTFYGKRKSLEGTAHNQDEKDGKHSTLVLVSEKFSCPHSLSAAPLQSHFLSDSDRRNKIFEKSHLFSKVKKDSCFNRSIEPKRQIQHCNETKSKNSNPSIGKSEDKDFFSLFTSSSSKRPRFNVNDSSPNSSKPHFASSSSQDSTKVSSDFDRTVSATDNSFHWLSQYKQNEPERKPKSKKLSLLESLDY